MLFESVKKFIRFTSQPKTNMHNKPKQTPSVVRLNKMYTCMIFCLPFYMIEHYSEETPVLVLQQGLNLLSYFCTTPSAACNQKRISSVYKLMTATSIEGIWLFSLKADHNTYYCGLWWLLWRVYLHRMLNFSKGICHGYGDLPQKSNGA